MNELQKEYFERKAKADAEAEAAEEAKLKKRMEEEKQKEARKKEAAEKAKEEADRKAEQEAIEIINRVKAEMAANKKKEAEEALSAKKAGNKTGADGKQEQKAVEQPEEETGMEQTDTEDSIYDREPAGEAAMPKKSPKFKKGGRKSGGQGRTKEEAATEEGTEEKTSEKSKGKNPKEIEDASEGGETEIEKATPEGKAAADREAKLQELADEYQDKYKRLLAEFENARAREAKEASRMYDVGAKAVLEKLLPIVDNFERAIQTIPEEDKERAFEQGVDKIYKQMMTVLEEIGVQPMNAEGTEFNPDMHNAVMHVEDEAFGENVVAEEMQKGYMYKDSVLRYSMVKVAN
ncbi:MAG: nucleotide exchange factor GrpE [Bacteroides sp.]|nr:nucleotide exchange factor GrpE [Bacteroides sp.]MCM1548631.1 nucleotide exchange factor GrpE [Clostridium sp.]